MFYPAKRVPPYNLWIGSMQDSQNARAARQHRVGLIVNCTRDVPFAVRGVRHLRVAVHDSPEEAPAMLASLPEAVQAIEEHLRKGDGVLVHCFAGVSRSASVVAAFLMRREGLTPRQAIARIQKYKPETFGNRPTFRDALEAWHTSKDAHHISRDARPSSTRSTL